MHIISISNQKGGCGKTTTAINLAASLAHLGRRTLLIDLDPQAHATFGLNVVSEKLEASMYNVLTGQPGRKKDFIEEVIVPIDDNLDLAPGHVLLSIIEQEFTNKDESVSKLHEALSALSFPYAFVVIDCPPSLGFLTFNALRASRTVIVPVELSSFSLMGVSKLLSMIELIRVKLQHAPAVHALATIVDMRTRFAKHMIEEVRRAFGESIFKTFIRQSVAFKESQAKGWPLIKYDARSKGAADYLALAKELLAKVPETSQAPLLSANDRSFVTSDCLKDFAVKADDAREVYLVGDFNNWSLSNDSLLWRNGEGVWQKRVFLQPGRYRYKFVIDGHWSVDSSNDHIEPNPYGGVDSVLEVC